MEASLGGETLLPSLARRARARAVTLTTALSVDLAFSSTWCCVVAVTHTTASILSTGLLSACHTVFLI